MVRCTVFATFLEQGFLIMAYTGHQQFFFFRLKFLSHLFVTKLVLCNHLATTRIFALEIRVV